MTGIFFLASSRPIILPEEIQEYNDRRIFDEPNKAFSLREADEWYIKDVRRVLTLPYIYEVGGIDSYYFWVYIEKYMEIGDVIELLDIDHQDKVRKYVDKILANPQPIKINVGSLTYTNQFGTFQLQPKTWIEDLKHRTLYTLHGVTTIVKY